MTVLRALVVDDEPLARQRLRRLLQAVPGVEVVGEAGSAAEALGLLETTRPTLLFLDVQMPGMDGFGVAAALEGTERPFLVFVTAHATAAVQAFDVQATDFLVKPVEPARLAVAVARARDAAERRDPAPTDWRRLVVDAVRAALPAAATPTLERFAVTIGRKTVYVPVSQVDWIEADGNYARLHVGRQAYLIRSTMQKLEADLDARQFVRIHRSTIVRVDAIRELVAILQGEYRVVLQDGTQLEVMRAYRDRLPGRR